MVLELDEAEEPKRALRKGMLGMDLRVRDEDVWGARGAVRNGSGRERLERVSRTRKSRRRMGGE